MIAYRGAPRPGRAARPWLAALALAVAPAVATAQGAPAPATPAAAARLVEGRIVRPTPAGEIGVGGVMVTLHRVGPDRSGPIDSIRTPGDGRYRFRYVPTGSDEALYFVSASYGGIAYFGSPLRQGAVSGDDAIITVFDTTSRRIPIRINGRHLIVSASDPGSRRAVLEVFELSNDSTVTLVGGRDSATFRVALPDGATEFQGGQGDVPPDAIAMVDGRAEVYAPLAPGIKQLSFSYVLPREAFPLTVPMGTDADVLEVLLEDSTGTVDGPKLTHQGPVESSGRTFVRWLAEDVPGSAVVRVTFPAAQGGEQGQRLWIFAFAVVALAAMSLGVLRVTARRRGLYSPPPGDAPAGPDPEVLARRIAALDAGFERNRAPSDAERQTYLAERERLKAELTDALGRRG